VKDVFYAEHDYEEKQESEEVDNDKNKS